MLASTLLPDSMSDLLPALSHPSRSLYLPRFPLASVLLAVLLLAGLPMAAHADDYADVSRLMRAGQFAEAQAKADQYLVAKPRDPQMRFLKGVLLTETGKAPEAIAVFTKITEDYPELPEPYNNLAVLYAGQNQFDKARAALEMAIRTNPSYATAHENLGDVYARLASQAYSRALQLDGGNAAVQPKLALIRTLFSAADNRGNAANAVKPAGAAVVAQASPAATTPAPGRPTPPAAPVAPTPAPAPASAPATTPAAASTPTATIPDTAATPSAAKEVEAAVRAWAAAWSSKDVSTYLASYSPKFDTPGSQNRKVWEDDRRARIEGKSRINVKLSNLDIDMQGAEQAKARFRQEYSADALVVSSRKTLELARASNGRWLIVRESTGN